MIVDLYMAPEVYKDDLFDRSVDAYSFGLILYEVFFSQILVCQHDYSVVKLNITRLKLLR